jgi:hypothetical protein
VSLSKWPLRGLRRAGILNSLGRAAASCNRKRDEAPDGQSQPGSETYEQGSLCRLPVENRPRTLNPKEWCGESRNERNGSKRAKGPGRTRDPRDQHQDEPDADSESGDSVESDGRNHVPPNRHQTIGREDAHHADDHYEESDEQCERFHVLSTLRNDPAFTRGRRGSHRPTGTTSGWPARCRPPTLPSAMSALYGS